MWLFSWEPWYVLTGSAVIVWALLKRLAGGHIGDYVAFLTFGVAAFGVVLAALVHLH